MTTNRYFVVKPDQHEPALNVLGVQGTLLASHAATHSYGITLAQGDEGMGPPPHSHDWDESFYVLNGQLEFVCEGQTHLCPASTLVHIPRGTVHSFRYGSGGCQTLEMSGADALATQMFKAVSDEVPSGPLDIPKVVEVLKRNGVTVVT
jgi:mannose-6-phosphate isomerase-like protein (cupin superfamily)